MDLENYERSSEVPSGENVAPPVVHKINGYGIPDRAFAIIKRHADEGGYGLDYFLNRKPWPLSKGRHRMVHARWKCWAELRLILTDEGKQRYSLPMIGHWFGDMDHTSILHGLDPKRRARAKNRYDAQAAAQGRAVRPDRRTYTTSNGTALRVISGDAV